MSRPATLVGMRHRSSFFDWNEPQKQAAPLIGISHMGRNAALVRISHRNSSFERNELHEHAHWSSGMSYRSRPAPLIGYMSTPTVLAE